MKKQLFTLALLTLGYVASSHGGMVLLHSHMNKFKETMALGETQMVRGVDVRIISQTPSIPGQSVVTVEEIVSGPNMGKWIITTVGLGFAAIEIDKKIGGYTKKFHTAEHDITVTKAKNKNKKRVTDKDGLVVDSIQEESFVPDEGIEVDEIEMNSEAKNPRMEMNAEGEVSDDVMNDGE